tara:strand:+ start:763 stop:1758 length:996 start_codon:yes stop_codon:yes gene_type:complete
MTKSKKEKNNEDENSITNNESVNEISNVEEQEKKDELNNESATEESATEESTTEESTTEESTTEEINNRPTDKDKNEESQTDELEKTKVEETEVEESPEISPNVSDDSDTDTLNNSTINNISEKLISFESESEKESEKDDSDDETQNLNSTSISDINSIPKIDNIKINLVKTVTSDNSFSISLKNEDLEKSKLSIFEKKIIKKIFVKSIESVREVIDNPNIESVIAITIIITNIAQLVEHIKINSSSHSGKLSGNVKKNIVIFLGRLIIEKNMTFSERDNILALYDVYADNVLERIIKFAKNNKVSHLVEEKFDESVSHLKNKSKECCIIS